MKAHRGNWGDLTGDLQPRRQTDPVKVRQRELQVARRANAMQRQAALDVLTAAFHGELTTIAGNALSEALRHSEAIGRISQQLTDARAATADDPRPPCSSVRAAADAPASRPAPAARASVYQTGLRLTARRGEAFEVEP